MDTINKSNFTAMYIKQILMNTANSIKNAEMIIIEEALQGNSKNKFLMIISRLRGVEKDIYLSVSTKYADIIKKEVMDNWETLSFQNIITMSSNMTDEQRRILEECAGHILDGTFKVEEQ